MKNADRNLVDVRRSSGKKEWMTREELTALNKERSRLREEAMREQSKKQLRQDWRGMRV